MGRLDGKVAMVTGGGGSGVGHGILLELAREGEIVPIVAIDLAAGESVRKRIKSDGGRAAVLQGDVSQSEQVRSVVEQVVREHKRLGILVNSAVVGLIRPVAEASEVGASGCREGQDWASNQNLRQWKNIAPHESSSF